MAFAVSVPVLSVQIISTEPSTSTDGKRRIRAFLLAMRCTPTANTMVTTAGRPSGIAATAMAIAA